MIPHEMILSWAVGQGLSEKLFEENVAKSRKLGQNIFHYLMNQSILAESAVLEFISVQENVPIISLKSIRFDDEILKTIPKRIVEQYRVFPVGALGKLVTIATSNPFDLQVVDDIRNITGFEVSIVLSAPKQIKEFIDEKYAVATNNLMEFTVADDEGIEYVKNGDEGQVLQSQQSTDEAPVVRMINLILDQALKLRASDIHFEPFEKDFRIRYRVDGALRTSFSHAKDMYGAIAARIKIMSSMNITEKRIPQDGRFGMIFGKDRRIDFRVSILPTYFGEKVVMRILDKGGIKGSLADIGLSPKPTEALSKAIAAPYGMVLVTGPTGSGKSTTLYSMLNTLNTPDRNLMTIEDPVEYQVQGITQTQAKPEVGLTFASGLRSLLRQSPDVVLVGEIRDQETADIAVKAALTGHLVFSTLHTNSAAGAMTRLIDMGVEPFLIASSLIAVAAQRLVKKICPHCRKPFEITEDVCRKLHLKPDDLAGVKAFKGAGCDKCNGSGYWGRMAVIEVLVMNSEMQTLVIERKSSDVIHETAVRHGMETLFQNALAYFKSGQTTLDEVLRIANAE